MNLISPATNPVRSMTHFVAKSGILTCILTLTPMIAMFVILLFCEYDINTITVNDYEYAIQDYRNILLYPIYVIASLTWIAGLASLVAMRLKVHFVLRLASFVYAAIGYWCILNILIVVFTAWSYLTAATIGHIFLWASIVALIWLFSAAVMNAYGEEMTAKQSIYMVV